MKSRNEKPKKKLETNIGKIIYGFLLFMPLLAIGVTCAYAIFNKNAYRTSEKEWLQNTTRITSNTGLLDNETYYINNFNRKDENNAYVNQSFSITFYSINQDLTQLIGYDTTKNCVGLSATIYGGASCYYRFVYLESDNTITNSAIQYRFLPFNEFSFVDRQVTGYNQNVENSNLYCYRNIYSYSNDYSNVKDAFYYSIDKVEQSNLFNWSKNSLIYTGMSNTAQALDISNTFIPMLLTYWLIISVFYYLYDIILIILNVFHRKIHELEESI